MSDALAPSFDDHADLQPNSAPEMNLVWLKAVIGHRRMDDSGCPAGSLSRADALAGRVDVGHPRRRRLGGWSAQRRMARVKLDWLL